jgi:hypothetical protein
MKQLRNTSGNNTIDFVIDITKEICPLTFVKTKLIIEKMQPGPEDPTASDNGIHTLIVQKEAG